jgi:hypothetical protein
VFDLGWQPGGSPAPIVIDKLCDSGQVNRNIDIPVFRHVIYAGSPVFQSRFGVDLDRTAKSIAARKKEGFSHRCLA